MQEALETLKAKAKVIAHEMNRYNIDVHIVSDYGQTVDVATMIDKLANTTRESLQRKMGWDEYKDFPHWFNETDSELNEAAMQILFYTYTHIPISYTRL